MPIYYIIADFVSTPMQWGIYQIVEVIECTLDDVQHNRVPPAYHPDYPRRQAFMFVREPDNPFREQATNE